MIAIADLRQIARAHLRAGVALSGNKIMTPPFTCAGMPWKSL